MREVYVLLTDTGTLFTRMIRAYTKHPLNHASLAFDRGLEEVYSFGRKTPNNPFIGGFVREQMNSILFANAKCAVFRCRIDVQCYQQLRRTIRDFDVFRHRYKYNLLGVIAVMFGIRLHRKNAYFCSQFVASVFEMAGCRLVDKPAIFVTPGDIARSTRLELVYEGELQPYWWDQRFRRQAEQKDRGAGEWKWPAALAEVRSS